MVAAVASFLQAKHSGGQWIVRVEDIDPPREVAGSAKRILEDLSEFGFVADGPILFQSTRTAAYEKACALLLERGWAYWCGCTRKDIPQSGIYPGTCRNGIPKGKKPRAIRVRVEEANVCWTDLVQGFQSEVLPISAGDFVIKRADGPFAYQLAVVVDDDFQKITEVVRGADLLDSTGRQIWLQHCLGIPTPQYAHIPVALSPDGRKLSKRLQSDPIRQQSPAAALQSALAFLGHDAPETNLAGLWDWALENWSMERVPHTRSIHLGAAGGHDHASGSGGITQAGYNA